MSDKKMIFFTTDSKPMSGGVADYLHGLCEGLGAQGKQVEMRSTVKDCEKFPAAHYRMKQLVTRPRRDFGRRPGDGFFLTSKLNTLFYYAALRQLAASEVRDLKPDDRVMIQYWPPEGHFWAVACRRRRKRPILIFHGAELLYGLKGMAGPWLKKDIQEADEIVVSSSFTGGLVNRVAGRDCKVVPPSVDAEDYRAVDPSAVAAKRKTLGISERARVVLSVGRLIARKGFDLAIEAAADVRKRFPDIFHVLVGDGPERGKLREKTEACGMSDRTLFLNRASDEEKWILYGMSDVFVAPNRTLSGIDWEGFGIVFLEAALAGVPSVGGNNGGVPDAIVDGETGFLVETQEDFQPTARAIEKLLKDEELRKKMGIAARERALKSFTRSAMARRMARVLHVSA